MIKGATKWVNPQTKETKQVCICGAKLPVHYNVHLGCGGKQEENELPPMILDDQIADYEHDNFN